MKELYQKYRLKMVKENDGFYGCKAIKSQEDVKEVALYQLKMNEESEEIFILLALDTQNRLIGVFEVFRGGLSFAIITPREIFKRLILSNANSFICVHNHPSGDTSPSTEDLRTANNLQEEGKMLQIELFDFCIVGDDNIYSFKKRG